MRNLISICLRNNNRNMMVEVTHIFSLTSVQQRAAEEKTLLASRGEAVLAVVAFAAIVFKMD